MAINAQVQIVIDAANSAKTVGDLKKNLADMNKELQNVEKGSQEFFQLTEAMNDTRDALKLIKKEVGEPQLLKNFQSLANIGSAMASGFQVAQGALNLFGIESDAVQKAMVKLQAAMAISQGLQQLAVAFDTAKKASMAMNASLLSNPYVLVAAAVVAASIAIYQYIQATDKEVIAEKAAAKQKEEIKKKTDALVASMSEEVFEFQSLTQALNDTNLSSTQRKQVIDQLNTQFGTTLTNLSSEKEIIEQTDLAYKNLINSIAKKIILEESEEKLRPIIKRRTELELSKREWELSKKTAQDGIDALSKSKQATTTYSEVIKGYETDLKNANQQLSVYNALLGDNQEEIDAIVKGSGLDLFSFTGINPPPKVDAKEKDELKAQQLLFNEELLRFDNEFIQKKTELKKKQLNGEFKTEQDYNLALQELEGENFNGRIELFRNFGNITNANTELSNDEKIQLLNNFNTEIIKITEDETANEIDINKAKEEKIKNDLAISNLEKLNTIEKDYLVKKQGLIDKAATGEIKTEQELNYQLAILELDKQTTELNILVQGSNEWLAKKAEIDKAKLELERKHNEDILKETDKANKLAQEKFTKTISTIGTYAGIVGNTFKSLINAFNEFSRQENEQALASVQQNTNDQIALAEQQKSQGILSEREYQDKILSIRKDAALKERKLKAEQWQKDKDAKIATAVIDTALAVVSALAAPFPVSIAASIAAGITGALQIGIISAQQPPAFARGGRITGAGSGTSDSITARVSNGESIINAKSTSAYLPVLDFINQAGGGAPLMPKFASGGLVGSGNSNNTGELLRAIRSIGTNQHIQVEAYLDPDKANRVFDERQRIKERRNRG